MGELFFDQDEEGLFEEVPQEEPPSRGRRASRWVAVLAVLLVVGLLVAAAGALYLRSLVDPGGAPGSEVAVEIPTGSSPADIGRLLAEEGVIEDAGIWRWYLRLKGGGPFLAGSYTFRENSSIGDAVAVLEDGPALAAFQNVTIPEGLTVAEVAGLVGESGFLDGVRFGDLLASGAYRSRYQPPEITTLEGLLFPDTYRLEEGEDEEVLLNRMIAALDGVAQELGYDDAEARTGRSAYEVLIVASLIEAEAKVDVDRTKISRVIYNRLDEPMSLGIDATVYYALGRRGGALTESDLAVDSPYNTRAQAGLPPTPIAIPGRASLEAAINPEPGPWLYYVLADASGVHAFSEGYDEFLDNVAAAREKGLL
ncbi:MAG: endolytic transglycosylase MltG [Actinomycetota bacterium]|nr:endolytic transglycosylase MltG [Actinomycetota bacterium]